MVIIIHVLLVFKKELKIMNWDSLILLMKNGENNTVRFFGKSDLSDDIGSTIVAMANTKGGSIFIGIDIKNYHLYGFNYSLDVIQNLINTHCRPVLKVETNVIEKNEKKILQIHINETEDKPYYYKNMCYIMDGKKPTIALVEKEHIPIVEKQGDTLKVVNDTTNIQTAIDINNPLIDSNNNHQTDQTKGEELNLNLQNKKENVTDPTNKTPKKLNERQIEALEYIELEKSIKNQEYRELFNVSHKTAHLELVDMVDQELIVSSGQGRSTHYIIKNKDDK